MADFDSSLPVRTESAGDIIAKIADATTPSQQLAVESDGSINVNASFSPGTEVKITDGTDTVAVNADGSLNAVVSATNLDIRDLAFATDKVDVGGSVVALDSTTLTALESITVQNGSGGSAVNIQDGGNSITVDGTVAATQSGSWTVTANAGTNLNTSALALNTTLTDKTQFTNITDGTDTLAVNTDGSINVVLLNDVPGTEICNRQTSAAVASAASTNHDYTVTTGKTFTAEQAVIAGSGKLKVQVLFNGVIKFDAFNSTANPTILLPMLRLIKAASTQVVRITITNLDNQAQDLYSTLMGSETP